ncbi:hypothetical protein [Microvirga roseola]|uniref:hypothetical protein n=1 Tax=Microvirga roseola TaxID=2883126 RepID=UPI001E3DD88C|nr:hypothetical protein [Microvirga roseola]
MSSLFGFEALGPVKYVIAFLIIGALLVLFGVVLRKLTGARLMMPGGDRNRSRQPRLGVVDIYELDRQRQLVLLRRDNVEHLLLIGGLNDVVIETNIVRVAGARIPAASNDAERIEPAFDQGARHPQVEAGRPSIEAQLAAQLGSLSRRPSEESDIDEELSAVASVSAPAPARPEPVLKPDSVHMSVAPAVQGLRAEARSPAPPPPRSAPEPVAERPEPRPAFAPPPFQSRSTPTPPAPPPAPPAPPPPVRAPQPAPAERRSPDAAVLSDMAKQLEEALKRPASPVPPPPAPAVAPAPAAPAPQAAREEVAGEDELLEPGPGREEPETAVEEAPKVDVRIEQPAQIRAAEPPSPAVEPVRPAPVTPPVQPAANAPAPAKAAEAPAAEKKEPEKAPDPFSVEDIEAEFARLLGRPLDSGKKG